MNDRFSPARRNTIEVKVGNQVIGGHYPILIQSMTTTVTKDIEATAKQSIALARSGCELVRITAPTQKDAEALRDIVQIVRSEGIKVPFCADIHFQPKAAFEALKWVEKVRINPGNFVDTKTADGKDYTEADFERGVQKVYDAFSPLVREAKSRGVALRIGTNHGSLSDRMLFRFGDSVEGMVESALEYLHVCEAENFDQIVFSMKASNPRVVIQAYRLLAARLENGHKAYPFHVGVTEAGDGEDGRLKSAAGIGALLLDGIGDTIRVSLTEHPVKEIPVARELVKLCAPEKSVSTDVNESFEHFYNYVRRDVPAINWINQKMGISCVPLVCIDVQENLPVFGRLKPDYLESQNSSLCATNQLVQQKWKIGDDVSSAYVAVYSEDVEAFLKTPKLSSNQLKGIEVILSCASEVASIAKKLPNITVVWSIDNRYGTVPEYRLLACTLDQMGLHDPIVVRLSSTKETQLLSTARVGSLFADGIGDGVCIEGNSPADTVTLGFNMLQAAGARRSKAEFVSCPSCGRTLFDLETTTQKIRSLTGHLSELSIAIMGCIVNGPGEMADADFGYVGGAPGKVNLFVGRECVKKGIAEIEAPEALVDLIKEAGRWKEPVKTS